MCSNQDVCHERIDGKWNVGSIKSPFTQKQNVFNNNTMKTVGGKMSRECTSKAYVGIVHMAH